MTIIVSAVLSIHNRGKLFRRALDGYISQTMPPETWEIVLVDDMSTEDLSWTYQHLIGKINLRHIKMDHMRHPLWKKRNKRWQPGEPENWYHTPAISTNLGVRMAMGPVICLCHPEILHAPTNFEIASRRLAQERAYLFGTSYLGTPGTNALLDSHSDWAKDGWGPFMERSGAKWLHAFKNECYWYTSFIPREAVLTIRGVDFEYLNGVAAEDDDFRERARRAGWPAVYDARIEGLHQDHSDEKERHRLRNTYEWRKGLDINRKLFEHRKKKNFSIPVNVDGDWSSMECLVSETRYRVGSPDPEIIGDIS